MNNPFVMIIITQLIVLAPFWAIGLIPFMRLIKVSKQKFWALAVLFVSAHCAYMLTLYIIGADIQTMLFATNVSVLVVSSVLCFLTLNIKFSNLLYVLFMVAAFALSLAAFQAHIEARFFPDIYAASFYTVEYILIRLGVLAVFLPIALFFLKNNVAVFADYADLSTWKYMWIIPAIQTLIINFYTRGWYGDLYYQASNRFITILLLLFVGSFFIHYAITTMIIQTDKSNKLAKNIAIVEHQLELQGEYYQSLRSHISEVMAARHDLRHHLTVIRSYVDLDDKEQINAYLNENIRSLPIDDEGLMLCENFAVNSILRYYINMAKNKGINTETYLDMPSNLGINNNDLCIIFGNCMENAIEACARLSDGKFIKISSKMVGSMLAITIDNSFDGNVKQDGDTFLSLKREGEGIGISSVKAVSQKYGGTARFEPKDFVFQVSVLLRCNTESSL